MLLIVGGVLGLARLSCVQPYTMTQQEINFLWRVWSKAIIILGQDSRLLRKDQCGAWIKWTDYGNRNSAFGWEIDHITPTSKGGSDYLFNLRPLHWRNNARKSDGSLICVVNAT